MRTYKIKLILLIVLFIAGSTGAGAANTGTENKNKNTIPKESSDSKKTFDVKPGGNIKIELKFGGDLEIKGWDKDQVVIEWDDEEDLKINKNGNSIEINNKGLAGVDLVLKVPRKFDISFSTFAGDIYITNIEGKIKGTTTGGDLDLYNIKGFLEINTAGGDINLKDSFVDGNISTAGGDVYLENVTGDIHPNSAGGTIEEKNVSRTAKSSQVSASKQVSIHKQNTISVSDGKERSISSSGGDIKVDEAPNGARLKTLGGDININYAGKYLDAYTNGGDIKAKSVDGWINAQSLGGDITVTMTGDPNKGKRDVTLTSLGGDIILTVPKGLSMNIEVEIAYTKYNGLHKFEDYKVKGDFRLSEERTSAWDNSKGTPCKYIYSKGIIGNGKNLIRIKTTNGNVTIKQQ